MDSITNSDIANFLDKDLVGSTFIINAVSSAGSSLENSLTFISKRSFQETTSIKKLFLVPLDKSLPKHFTCSYIHVKNPRLEYARVVSRFFVKKSECQIKSNIPNSTILGKKVSIGNNCYIGHNVTIGDYTVINHNVVIEDNTKIGTHCYIKSNTTIGEDGFGFEFDEDHTPIRIPHLGKVIIHNHVEIGASCTIARGTIDDTLIKNDVKIDDNVHISHNCYIDEKTIITAQGLISGSVKIGKKVWIGPNASIIQKVTIGDESLIGIGAIINKTIDKNNTIMGLEALPIKKLIAFKKKTKY